jgi:hypothetical protein
LAPDHEKKEKITSWLAIIFGTVGGMAVIFLSIFDVRTLGVGLTEQAFNYGRVHWALSVVFIVSLSLSTLSQTIEFGWLNSEYECYTRLRISYILKVILVGPGVAIAIAMARPFRY